MTQYLLSLPHDTAESPTMESTDPAALQAVMAAVDEFADGAWVFAGGLHPPATATTVDGTGAAPVLTDCPSSSRRNTRWLLDHRRPGPRRPAGLGPEVLGGSPEPYRGPRVPGRAPAASTRPGG